MKSSAVRGLVVALVMVATGCASTGDTREQAREQTPQEYLDWLSENLSAVLTSIAACSDAFDQAAKRGDYTHLKPLRVELVDKVRSVTATVRSRPTAGNHGEGVRDAYVELLEASHPFVDLLEKVETFDADVPDAQAQSFVAALESVLAIQTTRHAAFLEAIARYAAANGISLE